MILTHLDDFCVVGSWFVTKCSGASRNTEGTRAGPLCLGEADVRTDEGAGGAGGGRRGWGLRLRARHRRLRAWG